MLGKIVREIFRKNHCAIPHDQERGGVTPPSTPFPILQMERWRLFGSIVTLSYAISPQSDLPSPALLGWGQQRDLRRDLGGGGGGREGGGSGNARDGIVRVICQPEISGRAGARIDQVMADDRALSPPAIRRAGRGDAALAERDGGAQHLQTIRTGFQGIAHTDGP